jgi:tetratricopeptide (TPR) repeat protein
MMTRGITLLLCLAVIFSSQVLFAGYYEKGRNYYSHKKYDRAKEMFLKAVEASDDGNAYYFLGEIEKLQGNYREAEEYYLKAVSKKAITRQYLINSYWNSIVLAEQREDYQGVIKICRDMQARTGNPGARQKIESLINKQLWTDNKEAIEKYSQGIELKKSGKTAEAVKRFRDALSEAPSFLAPKFEIGMIAYASGDLDTTMNYLSEIAVKIPYYAEVHIILAEINFGRHKYRDAIDHFDKALEYGFTDGPAEYRARIKRGTCYYKINNFQEAEKDIEQALQFNSKSIEALLLLSAVKIKMEKYPEALKTLQKANSSHPNNPEILYQIGSIYYKGNDPAFASYFEKLFNLISGKKNHPQKYRKGFVKLAQYFYESKKYARAIAIVGGLDEKSQSYETRLLAARAHYQLKEYDEAIDFFEKISLDNEDKYILCRAYALRGRRGKAKAMLSDLMYSETYATKARQDPALSGIAREIENEKTVKKPETGRKTEEKIPDKKIHQEKIAPPDEAESEDEEE